MKKIFFCVLLTLIILATGVFSATFTEPVNVIRGATQQVNVTSFTLQNVTNCTIWAADPNYGYNITGTITNKTRISGTAKWINGTINTIGAAVDSSNYILRGNCHNQTDATYTSAGVESITAITVSLDNFVPVCSQSTFASNTAYDTGTTSTLTVTGSNSTNISVEFGYNTYSMTESSTNGTWTLDLTTVPHGSYDVNIFSGDGNNRTVCTKVTSVTLGATGGGVGSAGVVKALSEGDLAATQQPEGLQVGQVGIRAGIMEKVRIETQPMELVKTGGGVIGGAIVGTIVLPVVGTTVGAVIGGIVGIVI